MNVPEELKLDTNMAVVFKKHGEFNGVPFNAIYQQEDGSLMFFDTDHYHTSGTIKVAYKDVGGRFRMIRMDSDAGMELLRSENAYLRGKIEAYENFLGMKGFIEQKECGSFEEGLGDELAR